MVEHLDDDLRRLFQDEHGVSVDGEVVVQQRLVPGGAQRRLHLLRPLRDVQE